MYEETDRKFITKDIILLILKLVFLAIFIFIICWLFLRTNKGTVIKENDQEYTNNIKSMKEAAFEYFTKEKLPSKVGQSIKLTLEEMLNQKSLIDFTNNGQTCSLKDSYVQATKTADENYALKINLKCNTKEDYIVTTIEKKEVVCETCQNNTPTTPVSDKVTEDKNEQVNNNASNTVNKPNKNTTSTTTKKVTTKVVTKVTYNYNYYSFCDNNCEQKVKYYELVKYGAWQNGENYGNGYETKCNNTKQYNYCKVKKVNYYANCTVPYASTEKYHNFTLEIPYYEEDKPFLVSSTPYTQLSDYENYINSKKVKPANSDDKFYQTFPYLDANTMMESSLKENNFRVSTVGVSYYQGNFVLRYSLLINNKDNVKPYYSSNLGYSVNFIPLKITVGYNLKDSCVTDTIENAYKYPEYRKTYLGDTKTCQYRQVNYKWVQEKDLNSYLNQGWVKTGKTKTETK